MRANLDRWSWLSFLALASAGPLAAQGSLTLADSQQAGPGPGDNMVVAERRGESYVVSLALDSDEAVVHRMDRSRLIPVGRLPVGDAPRAIALARGGDFAVVANSNSDDLSVLEIGRDGELREVRRVSSQGQNPFDVAVAHDDLVLVSNRDSDELALFHLDRRGDLRLLSREPAGLSPHVVTVSPRGLVAVGNSGSNDLSLFELTRRGDLFPVQSSVPLSGFPVALGFGTFGRSLFVAQRSAQPGVIDDEIVAFRVGRRGQLEEAGRTPCGRFLTDLEATPGGLFAVTMTPQGEDQVVAYRRRWTSLTLDATLVTPGSPPPSFKQIATAPARGRDRRRLDRHVLVTEYQAGWLRSIDYER